MRIQETPNDKLTKIMKKVALEVETKSPMNSDSVVQNPGAQMRSEAMFI